MVNRKASLDRGLLGRQGGEAPLLNVTPSFNPKSAVALIFSGWGLLGEPCARLEGGGGQDLVTLPPTQAEKGISGWAKIFDSLKRKKEKKKDCLG